MMAENFTCSRENLPLSKIPLKRVQVDDSEAVSTRTEEKAVTTRSNDRHKG